MKKIMVVIAVICFFCSPAYAADDCDSEYSNLIKELENSNILKSEKGISRRIPSFIYRDEKEIMFSDPVVGNRFFGRTESLKVLAKRVDGLKDGFRQNIAVVGPKLIGKSSLVLHFFSTSYDHDAEHPRQDKARRRHELLTKYRQMTG